MAAAFNAMATPHGGSGTGYRFGFDETKFIEGPKEDSRALGSITWTVNATFTAGPETRSAWGAGIQAFPDNTAATENGHQLRSDGSTCSTQPRQVSGFSDGTTAEVCMNNGSPAGPHMNVTIIRGQLLINFVTGAQKETVAIAAAKDLAGSLEAAAQELAAQLT